MAIPYESGGESTAKPEMSPPLSGLFIGFDKKYGNTH
jgi:hypothetical protein